MVCTAAIGSNLYLLTRELLFSLSSKATDLDILFTSETENSTVLVSALGRVLDRRLSLVDSYDHLLPLIPHEITRSEIATSFS